MDVKIVARAVVTAQDAHEASWDSDGSRYTVDREDCFKAACEMLGLPVRLAEVLYLANTWSNDMRAWAEETLNSSEDATAGADLVASFKWLVTDAEVRDAAVRHETPWDAGRTRSKELQAAVNVLKGLP